MIPSDLTCGHVDGDGVYFILNSYPGQRERKRSNGPGVFFRLGVNLLNLHLIAALLLLFDTPCMEQSFYGEAKDDAC